jgi:endonuclease YncB( thermonuclease family)
MWYRLGMRYALVTLIVLCGPALAAEPITGRASATDGDTLVIHGARIRLFGIDAPESSQSCGDARGNPYPCGRRSAQALDERIQDRPVSCAPRDTDRYGRTVAVCSVGGQDLNGWMVRSGNAVAYTQYGRDYADAEAAARADRANIWQGPFENPADYRRQHSNDRGYRRAGGY